MTLTVRLFARARDLAQKDRLDLEIDSPANVATLRQALVRVCPELAPLTAHLHVAVNGRYADDQSPISPQDEIACFPPVSGG